jgi:hypothetical protein
MDDDDDDDDDDNNNKNNNLLCVGTKLTPELKLNCLACLEVNLQDQKTITTSPIIFVHSAGVTMTFLRTCYRY